VKERLTIGCSVVVGKFDADPEDELHLDQRRREQEAAGRGCYPGKRPVALVSEKLAGQHWRNPQNAIGKQIRIRANDEWRAIVGVVGDVHVSGMNKPAPWGGLLACYSGKHRGRASHGWARCRLDRPHGACRVSELRA
jgi:hypothetical protein